MRSSRTITCPLRGGEFLHLFHPQKRRTLGRAHRTRTDLSPSNSYHIRYSDLTNGSGSANPLNKVNGKLILLNNQTVHAAAPAPDTLIASNNFDPTTGNRVHNWLFSDFDLDDVIIGLVTSSDHKTKVS